MRETLRRLPGSSSAAARLLFLPVSPNDDDEFGSALLHAQACMNRIGLDADCYVPQYPDATWYANHPTDPAHQYESRLIDTIGEINDSQSEGGIPLVLVGFSKSGFGAMSLLRRHPGLVRGVIVWDAPLTLQRVSRSSMIRTYGDDARFQNYRLADQPLPRMEDKIIILSGWSLWGKQVKEYHEFLESAGVRHTFLWGPKLAHRWDSGWLEPCLSALQAALAA